MNKRYNKSESRKDRPYNKSKHRRPHPPYDEYRPRERRKSAPEALEMERGDALDFDLKVPEVNWQLPTIPDIDQGVLADAPGGKTDIIVPELPKVEAPKPKLNDPLELPEFEVKPKQTKPQVQVAPKSKAPQSLGQKPKPLTREQQIQREMQRRQAAQQQNQQKRPQTQRNNQVHPAAVVGPIIVMFIVMAFLSIAGVPPIVYLIVLFFFGRQIWNVIQGGGK